MLPSPLFSDRKYAAMSVFKCCLIDFIISRSKKMSLARHRQIGPVNFWQYIRQKAIRILSISSKLQHGESKDEETKCRDT